MSKNKVISNIILLTASSAFIWYVALNADLSNCDIYITVTARFIVPSIYTVATVVFSTIAVRRIIALKKGK